MIRLRRHTDGRVAVLMVNHTIGRPPLWHIFDADHLWGADYDALVHQDGWSELFVAELPEPDYPGCRGDQVWATSLGEIGVSPDGDLSSTFIQVLGIGRSDALRLLAAVAASERYRVEREATE